jgi:acetyltransferase-like isoleucine patch superfamily enzyme
MNKLHYHFEHWRSTVLLITGRVRARLLALRGSRVGAKARLDARCRVERPWCIKFGARFHAEENVCLKVVCDEASLEFGDSVFIGRGSEFDVVERVSVGAHSVIAPGCFVTDHNHGISHRLRIDQQPCLANPVTIGMDVWLGANVVVVAGVTIGDGAVVGASSVVTRDVPPMAVVAGVPARVLRYRDAGAREAAYAKQVSLSVSE